MKLRFDPPRDGQVHVYCVHCSQEAVERARIEPGRALAYRCRQCGRTAPRALVIDPAVRWWLDTTREYWHEVAGVFVGRPDGRFLFFERTKFPFGLTVPAGHLGDERPMAAAARELREETGLVARRLVKIATDDVHGDACSRGADVHRWHSFVARVLDSAVATLNDEGTGPVWLTLEQALACDLTFVTRYVTQRHAVAIRRAAR